MLNVKASKPHGCVFLGKGIEGRPEMGVIEDCREVLFDEWDVMRGQWTGLHEKTVVMYKTDNGYVFDETFIFGKKPILKIEEYAPNWRAHKDHVW